MSDAARAQASRRSKEAFVLLFIEGTDVCVGGLKASGKQGIVHDVAVCNPICDPWVVWG